MDEFEHWSGEFVKTIFSTEKNTAKQGDDLQMLLIAIELKEVIQLNQLWGCAADLMMNRARKNDRKKAQRHLKIENEENKKAKIKDKQTEERIIKNDVKEFNNS